MPPAVTKAQRAATRVFKNKYKKVPHKTYKRCRICEAALGSPLIELPDFPMTELYVPAPAGDDLARLDQALCQCGNCGHVQLQKTIPAEFLYGDNYVTRTSGSSAKKAIDDFLAFVIPQLPKTIENLLEIGCNDLYTLRELAPRAGQLCGIDPIWKGKLPDTSGTNIRVIGDFVEQVDPQRIGMIPDVVICSHTLEHIDDPLKLVTSLLAHAKDSSRLFFQFPGLEPLIEDTHFDQLHHQHLNYFSVQSVLALLERAGGELIDYSFNYRHWGALMISFKRATKRRTAVHKKFAAGAKRYDAAAIKERFKAFKRSTTAMNELLGNLLDEREACGFGAALMLPLLAYHLPELRRLEYIIDDDPGKQGQYYLNFPIRIIPASEAGSLADKTVVVTAINSKQNVRAITRKLIESDVRDIFIPTNTL